MTMTLRTIPALLLAMAGSCTVAREDAADTTADSSAAGAAGGATAAARAGEISGLDTPESVRYDAELDVYFVSNINGNADAKDDNGYIARVQPDSLSAITRLVEGGRNGAVLNAPKGLAIQGDTIWVSDIDVVRAFDRRTGAPIATIDFAAHDPIFLNDVAVGPDGIYVTDSNIRFESDGSTSHPGVDRIFRITGRTVTVAAQGDSLGSPNGITWDATGSRFIVGSYATRGLLAWRPGDANPTRLAGGPGRYDGVEILDDGRIVFTSWADSAVHVFANGAMDTLVRGVASPADLGVDTKRRRLLVPRLNAGVVSLWRY